jgi:putative tryptophan/tyrosine transport system substrate-binding protein
MRNFRQKMFGSIAVAFSLVVSLLSVEASAEKKIGVLLWDSDARYTDAYKGVVDQLKKGGFAEPAVSFAVENAGGNKAKAAELSKKIAAAKPDMVIAVGTSAAVPAANEIKDIPLVFTMVYDPVDSKIAADWKSSGNNTTGSSSKVPMEQIFSTMEKFAPVKNLAVLYTPGEKNSEAQLREVQSVKGDFKVTVMPVPVTSKDSVGSVMSEVVNRAQAIYITGSNIVGDSLPAIASAAEKAKVITVTHLSDLVEKGVLLGVTANPTAVGQLAGEKAAKVFKGSKPASIPIETLKQFDILINMKTAKASQIEVPAALKKSSKLIE